MNIDIMEVGHFSRMTEELWTKVEFFRPSEGFGDPMEMRVKLIYWLDGLRKFIGVPLVIHCGYELTGHAPKGTHPDGLAVDMHAVGMGSEELIWNAMRFPFTGLGLYKYWNNPGIHGDVRLLGNGEARKQWMRRRDGTYGKLRAVDIF